MKYAISASASQAEEVDLCADVDIVELERAGTEIMEHIVNIDLTTYQFDLDKLVDQAAELGYDESDFNFGEQ